jgi:hypothetical protein
MICGKRKMPIKVKNVPNDSENKVRNPKMNIAGKRAINFQPLNQSVVKELLVSLPIHENHISIKRA